MENTQQETNPTSSDLIAESLTLGADVADGDLPIGLRAMIESGAHFGHQTRRWNPKMKPYIYGARNGIHIIDLDQTVHYFKRAYQFVVDAVSRGGHVLFIGTKRQSAEVIVEQATRAGQFFVTGRWLGGTLTNFKTIKSGIDRLRELEQMAQDGLLDTLLKKEALMLNREREKLDAYLGGIKMMNGLPAALFVVDPHHEHIAIKEGRKLGIPIIALTDTNCDPDQIDFMIPANDDAIRSVRLFTSRIADACIEGVERRRQNLNRDPEAQERATNEGVKVEFSRRRSGGKPQGRGKQDIRSMTDVDLDAEYGPVEPKEGVSEGTSA